MIVIVIIIIIIIIAVTIIIRIIIIRKVITLMTTNCNYNYDHNHFPVDNYDQLPTSWQWFFLSNSSFLHEVCKFISRSLNLEFHYTKAKLAPFLLFFLPQKIFNKSIISLKELKLEHVRIFFLLFQYSSKIQPDVENFENNISFVLLHQSHLPFRIIARGRFDQLVIFQQTTQGKNSVS